VKWSNSLAVGTYTSADTVSCADVSQVACDRDRDFASDNQ